MVRTSQGGSENNSNFPARLKEARKSLHLYQDKLGEMWGFTGNYIYLLESGKKPFPDHLREKVEELERKVREKQLEKLGSQSYPPGNARIVPLKDESARTRKIPVVSWACAGMGGNFGDLAEQIDEWMDSETTDPNAYSLIIEGDSMLPKFEAGDRIAFEPNRQAQNGDCVVARLEETGQTYFKLFHRIGDSGEIAQLSSFNKHYPALKFPMEKFRFIHPMKDMKRIWRR